MVDIERADGHAILLVDDAGRHVVGIEGDSGRGQLFVGEANPDVGGEGLGEVAGQRDRPSGPEITIGDARDPNGVGSHPVPQRSARPSR